MTGLEFEHRSVSPEPSPTEMGLLFLVDLKHLVIPVLGEVRTAANQTHTKALVSLAHRICLPRNSRSLSGLATTKIIRTLDAQMAGSWL